MAQPTNSRTAGRALRADSIAVDTPAATPERTLPEKQDLLTEQIRIPLHYFLAPVNPSPFDGTFVASFDATLKFSRSYPNAMSLMDVLRAPVSSSTNWTALLRATLKLDKEDMLPTARLLLEDLFFLVTRKLFPEQIAQNRKLMARMYDVKKYQSLRTSLRYDMLLEWSKRNNNHCIIVESRPLSPVLNEFVPPEDYDERYPGRIPRMENVWATLLAGPPGGGERIRRGRR